MTNKQYKFQKNNNILLKKKSGVSLKSLSCTKRVSSAKVQCSNLKLALKLYINILLNFLVFNDNK